MIRLAFNGIDHFDVFVPNVCSSSPAGILQPEDLQEGKSLDSITVLCLNVNSWRLHRDSLLPIADILAVQETRLTAKGQCSESKALASLGYSVQWGAPCPSICVNNKLNRKARLGSGQGKQGGVALVCKQGLGLSGVSRPVDAQHLFQTSRWVHAAVPLGKRGAAGKRFLHLVSFYNISGRNTGYIKTQKERLLSKVFAHAASLGDQPVLICSDTNSSTANSAALKSALASGKWYDLGDYFTNHEPATTFCAKEPWDEAQATRPDFVLANAPALSLCRNFEVLRTLGPKGHAGLLVTLSFDSSPSQFRSLKPPRAFPVQDAPPLEPAEADRMAEECITQHASEFEQALKQGPDEAWHVFSRTAESFLKLRCNNCVARGEGGRHTHLRYQQRASSVCSASKSSPDATGTFVLRAIHRTLRQARELVLKLDRMLKAHGEPNEQCSFDISRLSHKVFSARKRFQLPLNSSDELLTLSTAQSCVDCLSTRAEDLQQSQARSRISAWRSLMRDSMTSGGKAAFAWLRDNWKQPLQAVQRRSGDVATSPQQIVQYIKEDWDSLYHQISQPAWGPFLAEFKSHIPNLPLDLPDITVKELRQQLKSANSHRAVGPDGWRVREMQFLPDPLLGMVAKLYRQLESCARWAKLNCCAIITCIPKSEPNFDVDDNKSSPVIPSPFDTRPICNISPWSTLYTSLRYRQTEAWRNRLLPDSMHGARRGHETGDVAHELALQCELAHAKKQHLGGVSLDRKNFFDLLPFELCFQLLEYMGFPQFYIEVERAFYRQLTCLYKAVGALSEPGTRDNGFLQGCSFSLEASQALLAVWTRLMESFQSCQVTVTTGGFLDDNNFRSVSSSAIEVATLLRTAWESSERFNDLSGIQTNYVKTCSFASTATLQGLLDLQDRQGASLCFKDSFRSFL